MSTDSSNTAEESAPSSEQPPSKDQSSMDQAPIDQAPMDQTSKDQASENQEHEASSIEEDAPPPGSQNADSDQSEPDQTTSKEPKENSQEKSSSDVLPKLEETVLQFLTDAKKHLSEQLRFHQLRFLNEGLFLDERAMEEVLSGYHNWFTGYASENAEVALPVKEKLQKKLFGNLSPETNYLLDGKTLLCGRLLRFDNSKPPTREIPFFRGSLLSAKNYIHMRDPLFSETEGIEAKLDSRGFTATITTRKQTLTIDNSQLQKIGTTLQNSRSLPKRFSKIQYAARHAIPALCEVWKKAQVVPSHTRLFVPQAAKPQKKDEKKMWHLVYGDLIFVQGEDGKLLSVYGLRGKNLHELLVSETESLRRQKRRPRFGSMTISPKGRGYGYVKLESDGYLLEPNVVRKFLERVPYSKELPDKITPRFTLSDLLTHLVKLIESSSWTDHVHVPRAFSSEHPRGTNYRSKGQWYFALTKKKQITALFDRHDPTTRNQQQTLSKKNPDNKGNSQKNPPAPPRHASRQQIIGIGTIKSSGQKKKRASRRKDGNTPATQSEHGANNLVQNDDKNQER